MRAYSLMALFFIVSLDPIVLQNGSAKANPLVVAVPPVTIGALETLIIASGAAASAGIITASQNEEFKKKMSSAITAVKTQTANAIDETYRHAISLYDNVSSKIKGKECTNSSTQSRAEICNSSPEECCKNLLNKFSNQIQKKSGGFMIWKTEKKKLCCLEWDYKHGAFEIFNLRGEHLGERACDDLNDDPCKWSENTGDHAKPNSATHKPRSLTCQH